MPVKLESALGLEVAAVTVQFHLDVGKRTGERLDASLIPEDKNGRQETGSIKCADVSDKVLGRSTSRSSKG